MHTRSRCTDTSAVGNMVSVNVESDYLLADLNAACAAEFYTDVLDQVDIAADTQQQTH